MDERRQAPPAFYGIYNDNDNNTHQRVNRHDMQALYTATYAMVDAVQKETQARIVPLETKMMAIIISCRREAGSTTSPRLDGVFQRAVQLFSSVSSTDVDTADIQCSTLEDRENLARTGMQLTEERNQLIIDNDHKILELAMDLHVVLNAHGWDPDDLDD